MDSSEASSLPNLFNAMKKCDDKQKYKSDKKLLKVKRKRFGSSDEEEEIGEAKIRMEGLFEKDDGENKYRKRFGFRETTLKTGEEDFKRDEKLKYFDPHVIEYQVQRIKIQSISYEAMIKRLKDKSGRFINENKKERFNHNAYSYRNKSNKNNKSFKIRNSKQKQLNNANKDKSEIHPYHQVDDIKLENEHMNYLENRNIGRNYSQSKNYSFIKEEKIDNSSENYNQINVSQKQIQEEPKKEINTFSYLQDLYSKDISDEAEINEESDSDQDQNDVKYESVTDLMIKILDIEDETLEIEKKKRKKINESLQSFLQQIKVKEEEEKNVSTNKNETSKLVQNKNIILNESKPISNQISEATHENKKMLNLDKKEIDKEIGNDFKHKFDEESKKEFSSTKELIVDLPKKLEASETIAEKEIKEKTKSITMNTDENLNAEDINSYFVTNKNHSEQINDYKPDNLKASSQKKEDNTDKNLKVVNDNINKKETFKIEIDEKQIYQSNKNISKEILPNCNEIESSKVDNINFILQNNSQNHDKNKPNVNNEKSAVKLKESQDKNLMNNQKSIAIENNQISNVNKNNEHTNKLTNHLPSTNTIKEKLNFYKGIEVNKTNLSNKVNVRLSPNYGLNNIFDKVKEVFENIRRIRFDESFNISNIPNSFLNDYNKLIDHIKGVPLDIAFNYSSGKKINIVLDIDNTFLHAENIKDEKTFYRMSEYATNFNLKRYLISLDYKGKEIQMSFIFRKYIKEFFQKFDKIANFLINSKGLDVYANKVAQFIQEEFNVCIPKNRIQGRIESEKGKSLKHFLDYKKNELDFLNNCIIIDDKPENWEEVIPNVISSHKFVSFSTKTLTHANIKEKYFEIFPFNFHIRDKTKRELIKFLKPDVYYDNITPIVLEYENSFNHQFKYLNEMLEIVFKISMITNCNFKIKRKKFLI